MNSERLKYLYLVLAPAFTFPFTTILLKRHEQNFFLGLSSEFWAGVLLALSVGCFIAGVAIMVKPKKNKD